MRVSDVGDKSAGIEKQGVFPHPADGAVGRGSCLYGLMRNARPRPEKERAYSGNGKANAVAFGIDPLEAAVVNFQPAALQIEKRVLVGNLGQRAAFYGDEKPL